MNTEELIKLFPDVQIIRSGAFNNLGLLFHKNIPNMLSYIKDKAYIDEAVCNDNISVIITCDYVATEIIDKMNCGVLVTTNPEKIFFQFHNYLSRETDFYPSYEFKSIIKPDCIISEDAHVSSYGVKIGRNTTIDAGAVIMPRTVIGDNCYIGPNTVIGTRGFQYYREHDWAMYVDHVAGVIIEDNVDILANSCVAAGLFIPTYIGKEAKIDNLVHIAHSVHIGRRCIIPAGAIIGGNVQIGDRAWIGINSTIRQLVTIGDDATVCMGAVVTRNVDDNASVSGNFAVDHYKNIEETKRIAGN